MVPDFEKKLDSIRPLRDINTIRPGKEWGQVAIYIKDYIVGREKYRQASEAKDQLDVHIIEMLDKRGFVSYDETARVIQKVFSQVYSEEKLELCNFNDIKYVTEDDHIQYMYKDEKVEICWCPSVEQSMKQVLLRYDDFQRMQKQVNVYSKKTSCAISSSNFDFQQIIENAYNKQASDVHITYTQDTYNVIFRINGVLEEQKEYYMKPETGLEFIKKMKIDAAHFTKGEFNADIHYKAQDAKIEYPSIGLDGVDVRLAFIPDGKMGNISAVARILKRQKLGSESFLSMGYYEDLEERILMVSKKQNGLIISSGITGSGKSTFISNVVASIDHNKKVSTVEDPIEYMIDKPNVTQHQVYIPREKDKKLGFLEYAKAFKRADPNVVFIGEMRNDPELVKAIMEMAEAGQLVLTTVHITSAFSIYGSLEEVFNVKRMVSVPTILFSINQVLVDQLCPHCKEEDKNGINMKRIEKVENDLPYKYTASLTKLKEDFKAGVLKLYVKGKGCEKCNHKGYSGRLPIYEYFTPNIRFIDWVLEHETMPSRWQIEEKACKDKLGVNKLDTFCRRLSSGDIDASESVIFKIL